MPKCPYCQTEGAYVSSLSVECNNPRCQHYKKPNVSFRGGKYYTTHTTEPLDNFGYWTNHIHAVFRFSYEPKGHWHTIDVYFAEETNEKRVYIDREPADYSQDENITQICNRLLSPNLATLWTPYYEVRVVMRRMGNRVKYTKA